MRAAPRREYPVSGMASRSSSVRRWDFSSVRLSRTRIAFSRFARQTGRIRWSEGSSELSSWFSILLRVGGFVPGYHVAVVEVAFQLGALAPQVLAVLFGDTLWARRSRARAAARLASENASSRVSMLSRGCAVASLVVELRLDVQEPSADLLAEISFVVHEDGEDFLAGFDPAHGEHEVELVSRSRGKVGAADVAYGR